MTSMRAELRSFALGFEVHYLPAVPVGTVVATEIGCNMRELCSAN